MGKRDTYSSRPILLGTASQPVAQRFFAPTASTTTAITPAAAAATGPAAPSTGPAPAAGSDTASSATTTSTTTAFTASAPSKLTPVSTPTPRKSLAQTAMEGWSKFSSSLNNINFAQAGTKFTKGFNSSVQATRERLGQVAPDEITELPQGELCSLLSSFFECWMSGARWLGFVSR